MYFCSYPASSVKDLRVLKLSFNWDGIPLAKSSGDSLWPLLVSFVDLKPVLVFPILFVLGKPANLDCLKSTMDQIAKLERSGLEIGQSHLEIKTHFWICDTPAKSNVKQIKGKGLYDMMSNIVI